MLLAQNLAPGRECRLRVLCFTVAAQAPPQELRWAAHDVSNISSLALFKTACPGLEQTFPEE